MVSGPALSVPGASSTWEGPNRPSLTLLAQEEGIEAEVVDAEIEPALTGHPALPAAARVIGDQLLGLREVEPGLELHQSLSELLGFLLLLGQPAACLLGDQSLTHREKRPRVRRRARTTAHGQPRSRPRSGGPTGWMRTPCTPPRNTSTGGEGKLGGNLSTSFSLGRSPAIRLWTNL